MRRPVALRLGAVLGTAAIGGVLAVTLPNPWASAAAVGTANGFAAGTTGGNGGSTVKVSSGTGIHQALCGRSSTSTPITIEVEGTINHGNTSKVSGSCSTASDVIELKGISNVTIIGVGGGATFDQIGIHIRDSSNIIIQNVTVKNVKKSGSPTSNGGDAIGMESTVRKVWVDHVTLEASGGESEGYDGLFDMKNDVENVTLSYSILRNSGRGGLIGSSEDDTGSGNITFHHNLYSNIDSRTPLLRGGVAHIYNNYYVSLKESGINSRAGAKARVENNYFKNSKDVLGTFYTSEKGTYQASGNILDNVTWSSSGSENYPAGPNMTSTGSVSIGYGYSLDGASCVPNIVTSTAGANTGFKTSNGSCSSTGQPTNPTTNPTSNPTSNPSSIDTNATYVFVNRFSGKAMDVYGWSTADGAPVNQWTRNNLGVQQWKFQSSGTSGYYEIKNVFSGKVLELASSTDGTQLTQSTDVNSSKQHWAVKDSGNGYARFVNRASGKAIDVWEWKTDDGAKLAGYTDLGGTNQQWSLAKL